MTTLRWLILAPFKLLGAILLAVGYVLAFLFGVGLLGGGTALTMSGGGAILGVPAMVIGFLVLRGLFDDRPRQAPAAQQVPAPPQAPEPPMPVQPYAAHGYAPTPYTPTPYTPAAYAEAPMQHARTPARHFCPRQAAYYWVPGRWTVR